MQTNSTTTIKVNKAVSVKILAPQSNSSDGGAS